MTLLSDQTRDIALEVAYNVRHLGGFTASNGLLTSDQFIRCGSLNRLTGVGIDRLRELDVRAVIDLRSPQEQRTEPTGDVGRAGIRVISAPVFQDDLTPARYQGEWVATTVAYERLLAAGMPAFRTLCETIADCDGAVLFHCTAGKDRTGVAAALLLDFAGVDHSQITADHARSADLLQSEFARFAVDMKERGFEPYQVDQMLSSKAEDMAATLDHISTRWGSSEGYLAAAGLSETARSAVRARIVA